MSGYIDLQINGYAGVDFNSDTLTLEDLRGACGRLQEDGVESILLTLITDSIPNMRRKIANVVDLIRQDELIRETVAGLHIEGPFLSPKPGFIGAHPAIHAQPTDIGAMSSLLDAGEGHIRLVTLAPEMDPEDQLTRFLSDAGILVSAGHTDASLSELQSAIDNGLSMFTHLGNGCPMEMNRHDNIISRALSLADQLWISFIADGAHIPFFALRSYLKVTGLDRVVIVTDAIGAAGALPGHYTIGGRSVEVGEDGVPRSEDGSHLVGSGCTMKKMVENCREELLLETSEIDQLTKTNPGKLLAMSLNSPAR